MKRTGLNHIVLLLVLLGSASMNAQVFWSESFETDGAGARYTLGNVDDEFDDGASDFYGRTDSRGNYTGQVGTFYWAGEDIDDGGGNGINPKEIIFNGASIAGMTEVSISGLFGSSESGIDNADFLQLDYRIDGGAWTPAIWFAGSSGFNTGAFLDTDFDGTGDGTALSSTLTSFSNDITVSGSTIELRMIMSAGSGSEAWGFDFLEIDNISPATSTTVSFDLSSSSVIEGNGNFNVELFASNPDPGVATTVEVSLTGGTATNGTDYSDGFIAVNFPETVTFPAGVSGPVPFTVFIEDDNDFEGDETIELTLINPAGGNSAALGATTVHTLTITDDEIPTTVEWAATSSTLTEDGAFIDINVSIADASMTTATTVEVDLDGASTATNGTDYDDGAGTPMAIVFPVTLTFPAGSTADQTFTIFISNDDLVDEADETVVLNLQNPMGGNGAQLGTNTQHTLTIQDDDGPVLCAAPVWEVISPTPNTNAFNNDGVWTAVPNGFEANGFCGVGCSEQVETWLVFGSLDIGAATILDLNFDAAESFGNTDLNVYISTDYGSNPCPSDATWLLAGQVLAGAAGPQTIDLSVAAATNDVYIGIEYNDDGADGYTAWTLTNFALSSDACPTVNAPVTSNCVTCAATVTATGATCDANTAGTDTYTSTFDVDATGETEDLTITVDNGGTPDITTVTAGTSVTVTVTGVDEGNDVTLTATNSICIISDTQTSPVCIAPLAPTCGVGETSLVFDSFEGGTIGTPSPAPYSVGSDVWSNVTSIGTISAPFNGLEFWGMEDLANGNGGTALNESSTIVYTIPVAAGDYTSLNLSFHYWTAENFESTDFLYYLYDDGVNPQDSVSLDVADTGGWIEVTASLPVAPTATSLTFTLGAVINGGDNAGWDELNICGSTTAACTASIAANSATCNAETAGVDTYTATFDFDASGETEDLTVSTSTGSADISTVTAGTTGTITVTGINEGTDVTVTLTNTACDINASLTSPSCIPTPDIIITEIMKNPDAVADGSGEYFELYNAGAFDVDIEGWTVQDLGSDDFVINNGGPLTITAGGYLVLGNNGDFASNGGVNVDYEYTGMFISNTDEIEILDLALNSVDLVDFDPIGDFPNTAGAAMSLDPDFYDADANDVGANWCEATSVYGDGDFGTPGSINDQCVEPLANEDCSGALPVNTSLWGTPDWQTFSLGSSESEASCGGGDADDDVWFSFVAQAANDVILAQDPTGGYNAVVEVFESCGGSSLGCFDNYGNGDIERAMPMGLTVGQTYNFRVFDAASGASASTDVRVMVKTFADAQLRAQDCNSTDRSLAESVYSTRGGTDFYNTGWNPTVGYAFRFQEQGGGLDVTVERPVSNGFFLQLADVPGLEFGKTYDVQVSHSVLLNSNGLIEAVSSDLGSTCSISMAAGPAPISLRPQFCTGLTEYTFADQLQAENSIGADSYVFTFDGAGGPFTITKPSYGVSLFEVGDGALQYGQSYSVTVSAVVDGVAGVAGAPCTIFMASQPGETQVRDEFCDQPYTFPSSDFILAQGVLGADQYEFRFSQDGTPIGTEVRNGVSFYFNQTDLEFMPGVYDVDVRVIANGSTSDYVNACPITIVGGAMINDEEGSSADLQLRTTITEASATLYPNPNTGAEFILHVEGMQEQEGLLRIDILDITGKTVWSEAQVKNGGEGNFLVRPGTDLETGIYLVRWMAEGQTRTIQMLVK
jgi:hypothetical protein